MGTSNVDKPLRVIVIAATICLIIVGGGWVVFDRAAAEDTAVIAEEAVETILDKEKSAAPENPVQYGSDLPGYREIHALEEAFPDRVGSTELRDGEWALSIEGTWYYWAEGRILPEPLRSEWDRYVPIRFYNYTMGPWTPPSVSAEAAARLATYTTQRDNDERERYNTFLDTLYQVNSRSSADAIMRPVTFLDMRTHVHPAVVDPLMRVEERIRGAMIDHQETRRFVRDLAGIHGYNWRVIAGTQRRSYHAYGMAVDLVPHRYDGGWGYWRWAADSGVDQWWNLDADERWTVPQPIIDAFESEGFVWGGKWLFFDNVHFEYRPEVIYLSRITAEE